MSEHGRFQWIGSGVGAAVLLALLVPGRLATAPSGPDLSPTKAGPTGTAPTSEKERFVLLERRARKLAGSGQVGQSVPYWEELLRLQPYNEKVIYRLGLAHLHRKDLQGEPYIRSCRRAVRLLGRSVRMYRRVADRGPELGLRLLYLGLAQWYSGEPEAARASFRGAYRADLERRDAIYNRVAVLEDLGRRVEADVVAAEYRRASQSTGLDD